MTLKALILLGDVGLLTSQRPRRLHYTKPPAAGDEADSEGSKDQKHVSVSHAGIIPNGFNEASHCPICKLPHARLQ
jgi:hypothetical protein